MARAIRRPISVFLAASLGLAALLGAGPAFAAELRWTAPTGLPTLAPHALPGQDQQGLLATVYEGLTRRTPALTLEPGLATSWRSLTDTRWRFSVRRGVRFHNGAPFEVEDVVASLDHARGPGSALADLLAGVRRVKPVDSQTVDLFTTHPIPDLPERLALVPIAPRDQMGPDAKPESTKANGTGPFVVTSFTPNGPITFDVNPLWWDRLDPALTSAAFYPAASPAERLRFLMEDRVDIALDLDPEALPALRNAAGVEPLTSGGARTLILGMDVVSAGSPFRDQKIREAVLRAVDVEALNRRFYNGMATPAAIIASPAIAGFPRAVGMRPAPDPARARSLAGPAGRPSPLTLDCPSGHYAHDASLCGAVADMLTQAGLPIRVATQPAEGYFDKILRRESRFYLLGWQPATLEIGASLSSLAACPQATRPGEAAEPGPGALNLGGYCNEEADRLIRRLNVTTDPVQRQAFAARAMLMVRDDLAYVPLLNPPVVWGKRDRIRLPIRADGVLDVRAVTYVRAGT
ncbi:ABC transporter substrate-binding protein [Pararhodospirillum photometricum]|nr:ABC transporter substrate-binding protein [Pararhodospirillum photometricum]